ncbi:helix-turn-helix transcriptional regulator [Frankia sp. Cppng1_Ct_nod]|uniref:helix-turn-helix domain-containing protein n=1 Tax=Frankia sp. Cppng1_Ct_nod TaxID=2897162 RepID=UPI001041BBFF|nr:helix-turn-helix transcriptional regulator [Frankia sp. Cppng1_Ct_nod]
MPPLNMRDLGDFIRDQRKAAQISLRQLARQAGVSNPYLSQIERGLRKPSAEILQQIAKALRISAEVLYIQAGILDERSADNDVVTAVLADTALTERQKQVIVEIYDAFRKENVAYGLVAEAAAASGPDPEQSGSDPDRPASDANADTADTPADTAETTVSSPNGARATRTAAARKPSGSATAPRPRTTGAASKRTPAAQRKRLAVITPESGEDSNANAGPASSDSTPHRAVDADEADSDHPNADA